jgi:hypothetical protein
MIKIKNTEVPVLGVWPVLWALSGTTITNQSRINARFKGELKSGNGCYKFGTESFVFQFAVSFTYPNIFHGTSQPASQPVFIFYYAVKLSSRSRRGVKRLFKYNGLSKE